MGRIIRGQTIASTHTDSSGDKIPREQLRELFLQIPDEYIGTSHHDFSGKPFSKGFNKQLVDLPDGELAIQMDIEILDEYTFSKMGGFSIAYTRNTLRCGRGEPIVNILLNPIQFDVHKAAETIERIIPNGTTVDVTERVEKAGIFVTAIIIIVVGALLKIVDGFLNAAGANIYNALKNLRRKDTGEGDTIIHLHLNIMIESIPILVVLVVSQEIEAHDIAKLKLEKLASEIQRIPEITSFSRIVGEICPGGEFYLDRAVKKDGQVHHILKTIPVL